MKVLIDEQILQDLLSNQNTIIELINKKISFDYTSQNNIKSNLMTVAQSAEFLNVSEIFLRKRIESKELKVKRIGGAVRIEINELGKLIK